MLVDMFQSEGRFSRHLLNQKGHKFRLEFFYCHEFFFSRILPILSQMSSIEHVIKLNYFNSIKCKHKSNSALLLCFFVSCLQY